MQNESVLLKSNFSKCGNTFIKTSFKISAASSITRSSKDLLIPHRWPRFGQDSLPAEMFGRKSETVREVKAGYNALFCLLLGDFLGLYVLLHSKMND